MTEKRFHIINGAENLVKYGIYCKPVLVDEETGKQYVLALDLMDILNELYEENKELKKEMSILGELHAQEINKIEDEFDKEILQLEKYIQALEQSEEASNK